MEKHWRRKRKICIVTSVHQALDSRIFYKEASSLAAAGHDVILIGRHDKKETVDGVDILPLPKPKNRLSRLAALTTLLMKAHKQHAHVYHFHDPELLLLGPWLKLTTRCKLIFDAHEDVKEQINDKQWIPKPLRRIISFIYVRLERQMLRFFDAVIIAEDSYMPNFAYFHNIICIHNYPLLTDEPPPRRPGDLSQLVYVGGLSRDRGALTLVSAIELVRQTHRVKLLLAGPTYSPEFQRALEARIAESDLKCNIETPGKVPFPKGQEFIRSAGIGLACLHPVPNNVGSLVTKLFEYMAAGLPIVASNFPLWEKLFTRTRCGLTVDPLDPRAIASAITWLMDHPDQAREMGANGRQAVLCKYNWTLEKDRLIEFYERLIDGQKVLDLGESSNPQEPIRARDKQ